jgi:GGDEF domain-containing protein
MGIAIIHQIAAIAYDEAIQQADAALYKTKRQRNTFHIDEISNTSHPPSSQ